jgi:hypothetical protein
MIQAFLITGGAVIFGVVVGALYVLRQFQKGFRW